MNLKILLFLLLVASNFGNAQEVSIDIGILPTDINQPQENVNPPKPDTTKLRGLNNECLRVISVNSGIHVDIFFAILAVEGGTVGRNNSGNKNRTYDFGIFQINDIHIPELNELNITREEVMNDGCLSAAVAARHLLKSIKDQPVPTTRLEYLQLLARYHSKTPEHNLTYALKLGEAFDNLYIQDENSSNEMDQNSTYALNLGEAFDNVNSQDAMSSSETNQN